MKLHLTNDQKTLLSIPILTLPSVTHTAHTLLCDIGAVSLSSLSVIRTSSGPVKYESASRPKEAP